MSSELTIVIPCYNEEENIPLFFPKLIDFIKKHDFEVIAVNDGSTDNTVSELEKFKDIPGFKVISHKCNQGYGGAIKTGLKAARTEFAITIDSDGQHRLEDVLECFSCIKKKNADLIVGARQNNHSGWYRSIGKWVIRTFAASLLKLPIRDLNSGMKCYRLAEAINYLDLCPDTMAFSDVILLLMVNDGKLVAETPITVEARTAGTSTINARTALVTIAEILNLAILLRPITTFFRLGMIFFLAGIGWGIFTYSRALTITPAAIMVIILGVLCFILGLLGEQLSQIRKKLARIQK